MTVKIKLFTFEDIKKTQSKYQFALNGNALEYVASYKYLGCIINESLNDNDDIKRTLCGIYARGNMLVRKFHSCSENVKQMLFRTYCTNPVMVELYQRVATQSSSCF